MAHVLTCPGSSRPAARWSSLLPDASALSRRTASSNASDGTLRTVASPYGVNGGLLFDNTSDYLMWNVVARWETFGGRAALRRLDPATLSDLVLDITRDWHPRLRDQVAQTDLETLAVLPLQTSHRPKPWTPTNVTLLGDAIHAMPPTAGAGANTACVDANTLRHELNTVIRDGVPISSAIGRYEAQMRAFAFKYVAAAERNLSYGISANPLALGLTRTALSVINRVGPFATRDDPLDGRLNQWRAHALRPLARG